MYEVTNENFKEIYPQLECILKNASFVAIDTELTGIEADNIKNRLVYAHSYEHTQCWYIKSKLILNRFTCFIFRSLFDSVKERYDNQRNIIRPYIIIQFGLVAFQRVQDKNEYVAQAFNFFVLPRSIPTRNRQFLWQTSALEFLTTYGFDFNKVYIVPFNISLLNFKNKVIHLFMQQTTWFILFILIS